MKQIIMTIAILTGCVNDSGMVTRAEAKESMAETYCARCFTGSVYQECRNGFFYTPEATYVSDVDLDACLEAIGAQESCYPFPEECRL